MWSMAKDIGYEPKTTYWEDFTFAEPYGQDAIKDMALAAFKECKDNYILRRFDCCDFLCNICNDGFPPRKRKSHLQRRNAVF